MKRMKFIKVMTRNEDDEDTLRLININHIVSVEQTSDGTAYIYVSENDDDATIDCRTTFDEVCAMLRDEIVDEA